MKFATAVIVSVVLGAISGASASPAYYSPPVYGKPPPPATTYKPPPPVTTYKPPPPPAVYYSAPQNMQLAAPIQTNLHAPQPSHPLQKSQRNWQLDGRSSPTLDDFTEEEKKAPCQLGICIPMAQLIATSVG
ncbi:hypothetical protein NP233_g8596 [Leucocoprinus birnbaumii]|uniref:Uncharacterized protein n=1 Tax=Leucocoprinus birnbaumii TaxID=56174 RepID=A0AAD5VNQ9_9AGAR|nr:hypothetical protein NP233_g8596 [Leucocoprinus birnbaumii]